MQGKYSVVFSICCLVSFAQFSYADPSVAKRMGQLFKSLMKEVKGAEKLSDADIVKILTASDLKESDQCLIEAMLEDNYLVDKQCQPDVEFIKGLVKLIQSEVPKPDVDLAQQILDCDYKPKDNVCLAGFKGYDCARKVLETYLGEGLFN